MRRVNAAVSNRHAPFIAAMDLGSNSFHLLIAKQHVGGWTPVKHRREVIRLQAGMASNGFLSQGSMQRALHCLDRFRACLRFYGVKEARAVGTATLRQAKNSDAFIQVAQRHLGFPIRVITGCEEAKMTYCAVIHSLNKDIPRLIIDVGGGSTEIVFGCGRAVQAVFSVDIGCVALQRRFFPTRSVSIHSFSEMVNDCIRRLEPVHQNLKRFKWETCLAASGTAQALGSVGLALGLGDTLTLDVLCVLKEKICNSSGFDALNLPGLRSDRKDIFPCGVGIFLALFRVLGLKRIKISKAALKNGILLSFEQSNNRLSQNGKMVVTA